jgi:hypothetical protein
MAKLADDLITAIHDLVEAIGMNNFSWLNYTHRAMVDILSNRYVQHNKMS